MECGVWNLQAPPTAPKTAEGFSDTLVLYSPALLNAQKWYRNWKATISQIIGTFF